MKHVYYCPEWNDLFVLKQSPPDKTGPLVFMIEGVDLGITVFYVGGL